MTEADALDLRRGFLAAARSCGRPDVAARLRTLAANLLFIAADPTDEALWAVFVQNCRLYVYMMARGLAA